MSGLAAVIGCASGCLGAQRQALTAAGVPPVEDLLDFLGCRPGHATPALHGARVALMVPCTQRTLDRGAAARAALRAIRGVTTVELEDAPGCCGAGALQFMADPETAAALRRQRVAQIAASGATIVATTNTGCRIHLRAGLAEAGLDLPVVHPAAIIGASIPDPETAPPCADRPPRTA